MISPFHESLSSHGGSAKAKHPSPPSFVRLTPSRRQSAPVSCHISVVIRILKLNSTSVYTTEAQQDAARRIDIGPQQTLAITAEIRCRHPKQRSSPLSLSLTHPSQAVYLRRTLTTLHRLNRTHLFQATDIKWRSIACR